MNNSQWQFRIWKLFGSKLGVLLLLLMLASAALPVGAAPAAKGNKHEPVHPGPVDLPHKPAQSPHRPSKPVQGKPVNTALAGTHEVDPIDLKLLVIAADEKESDFPAITAFLDQIGVPYDVLKAATEDLAPDRLWDPNDLNSAGQPLHGYYQGVILTTDSLVYFDSATGTFPSAFTPDEWNTLWTYESMFGIRQVTFNTTGFGPELFGLNMPAWNDQAHRLTWEQTRDTPVKAKLTAVGQTAMPYLNSTFAVPFTYADVVLATAAGATPLLSTADGYALVSSYTNLADGRENLAITADSAPWLTHSLLLSYGAINWVTKGLFLGERHVYLNAQPDDLCIDDNIWNPSTRTDTSGSTYRMTGNDFKAAITWQNKVRSQANTSQFMLEWPFVAEGCSGLYANDTLTAAIKQYEKSFQWINHTWDHSNLNYPVAPEDLPSPTASPYYANYGFIKNALTQNDAAAKKPKTVPYLSLSKYNKDSMVQPDISGLYNPYFYQAAYDFGIRYIISDTSRKPPKYLHDWSNPSPNAGYYAVAKFVTGANGNPLLNPDGSPQVQLTRSATPLPAPALLVVPRHPTNLFYNLVTPDQWVSEYNCFYSKASAQTMAPCAGGEFLYWDNDRTYAQILDSESEQMLQYLLKWDLDPLMFHQPNAGFYATGKSLLGDLIDATLLKYNSMYKLPILSPSQHDQGIRMANRMAYNSSGVTAQMVPCGTAGAVPAVTIKAANAARIPLTGLAYGTNKEVYGGQNISYIDLPAGGSLTMPLTCP